MLTSETINKILKKTVGSFSDNVFKLMEAPTKGWLWGRNSCPNDVYVYDSEGNLCGSIVGNQVVETDGGIFMYTVRDEKYFILPEDDYMIKFVGNGSGAMRLEMQEWEGDEKTRTVVYDEIPLEEGKAYTSMALEYRNADISVCNPVSDEGEEMLPVSDTLPSVREFVLVTGVALDRTVLGMAPGQSQRLTAAVMPENAANRLCEWSSSNERVAIVDKAGKVTAVSEGSAVITAATVDGGYVAFCTVNVKKTAASITQKPDTSMPAYVTDPVLDTASNAEYVVTSTGGSRTVEYRSPNKSVQTVVIPESILIDGVSYKVTSIAPGAFKGDRKLTKVAVAGSVETIGASAFNGCTKLKSVTLGKNVTVIGDKAFYNCTALTKITIPSKVKKIGKQAFFGCKKLSKITIKTAKLTSSSVGSKAFKGIHAKAVIKVPKKKLGAYKNMLRKKGVGKQAKIKK